MKFKKMAALLMAGAMVLGMGIPVSAEEKEGADEITIWAWDEAFNIKAANVAKEMYAEANPDVKVNVVTMAQDDIVAKLNTSLASGSYEGLPDIVLIEDYRIQGYLKAYPDEFADLSDIVSPDDFAEYKTGVNQVDGKTYGVPFDSGVAAVFYRTDYIEEAGYTTEDMQDLTWDKYIEIGEAVKEKTGKHMLTLDPSDLGQIRMMLQSAGAWYTDEEGNVTIKDNQALKDAITTYKKIVDSGISKQVADWDQFVGAFNSGDVASVPTGCWISPSVLKAEDQSGKWAVAPFPKMAENENSVNASSIGGGGWYVLKNVGHEDAAKAFLKDTFASSTELMNQLATDINLVSTLFLRGFQYVFLSICSIISIFSFIWMIIAATNKSVDVTKGTLMPGNYLMENLKAVFSSDLQYGMAFKNSLVIAAVTTLLAMVVSSAAFLC